jgi:hypothetical protein
MVVGVLIRMVMGVLSIVVVPICMVVGSGSRL